ncbi:glycosyltransferase family 4 protein [Actinotalea sp. BY-33]|uniref:Glycosyltransferase family 4 protein n=1 Tax=Actinotalea soli TaxID=2819234 RepID=A0A939LP59_9CELL|nr:glycosyltransferase family 4 protein [Actinotalea soli]MBO1750290.1 glycosyltransferase family 4 protein [Actinotalea soli]
MRILVVHNRYRTGQPSGEDVVVDQDLRVLADAGHDVRTYQRESDDIATWGLAARGVLPARVLWSPGDAAAVRRSIEDSRPDVMHVHNTFPVISPSVLGAARRRGVPVVATLHNYRLFCASGTLLREGRPCTRCIDRSPLPGLVHGCYRGSRLATAPVTASVALHGALRTWTHGVNRFVVMTEFARSMVTRAGLPEAQVVVRPHGVSEAPQVRDGAGDGFLYVGRLSHEKGIDLLIDAWDNRLGRLEVIGDGDLATDLRRRVADRALDVVFLGSLPQAEVRCRMASARALVVPSRAYETFGLSAVEAMAAGVPVVVAGHGALAELAERTGAGVTHLPNDVEDLRRALGRMDPETAVALGRRARAAYLAHYSMAGAVGALEAIYRDVVREGAEAR